MIIGIPVEKDSMDGKISQHFGRTNYFLIYDEASGEKTFVDNTAAASAGGAGIKAAQIVVDHKVEVLISPRLGKNAYDVVDSQGIKIYQASDASIEENIELLKQDKLSPSTDSHEGFHNHGR